MTSLLSEGSRNDEIQYIREDVTTRLAPLKRRLKRWWSAVIALGAGSLTLIVGGASMLALGQLPDSIELVAPAIESVSGQGIEPNVSEPEVAQAFQSMIDFMDGTAGRIIVMVMIIMGIVQGIARQSIMGFVMGIVPAIALSQMPAIMEGIIGPSFNNRTESPFAAIQSEFEDAAEANNWSEAWRLLESVPASESDLRMLKAQVAFQAGEEEESLRVVQASDLGATYPARTWRLESLYAERGDYELSEASEAYAADQASRRSMGSAMLRNSVPFGVLALLAAAVVTVLRRNVQAIDSWVKPAEKSEADAIPNQSKDPVHGSESRQRVDAQKAESQKDLKKITQREERRDMSGNLIMGAVVASAVFSGSDSDAGCEDSSNSDDPGSDDCGGDD